MYGYRSDCPFILLLYSSRYFVSEVLDTIAPPYSPEFAQLFLPLVENDEIFTDSMRREGEEDPVAEFIIHCRANFVHQES